MFDALSTIVESLHVDQRVDFPDARACDIFKQMKGQKTPPGVI